MTSLKDPVLQQCYQQWLGITVSNSPPTHYELLGIKQFENDSSVIQTAARQRSTAVRQFQNGEQGAKARIILHEITKAKTCLLDSEAKRAYDNSLRSEGEDTLGFLEESDLTLAPPTPVRPPISQSTSHPSPLQPIPLSPIDSPPESSLDSLFNLASESEELLSAESKVLPPALSKRQKSVSFEPKAIAILVSVVLGGSLLLGGVIYLGNRSLSSDETVAEKKESEIVEANEEPVATPTNSDSDIWKRREKQEPNQESRPESPLNPDEESNSPEGPANRPVPEQQDALTENPFTKVVSAINLPQRPASSFGETEVSAVSLGTLDANVASKLKLELATQPGWDSTPITFKIEPREDSDASAFWDVRASFKDAEKESSGLGQSKGLSNAPVAVLSVLENSIKFQWLNSNFGEYLEYLRFYALRCSVEKYSHQISLREISELPHIPLEFTERRQKTLLNLIPLPPDAKLSMQVVQAENIGTEYNLAPPDGVGQLNDTIKLDLGRLLIEVRLEDTPELAVVVSGEYEVRSQGYDFFAEQLKEHVDGLTKKLKDDAELEQKSQTIEANITSRMFTLEQVANNGNNVEKVLAAQEYGKLASNLKTVRNTIKRIQKSRPILIADLNQANSFASKRTALASEAVLQVKIRATLGDQTFDIAEYGVLE